MMGLDHRGEALPYLSKSAKNMKMDRLLSTPMPNFEGETPGSYFWTKVIYGFVTELARYNFVHWRQQVWKKYPLIEGHYVALGIPMDC